MADIATAFVKIMPSAQGIREQLGRQFEGEGESSGKSFGKGFGGLLKKVLTGAAVAKSLKAFGSIVRQGVDAYANYEQLVGGVETLFGTGGQGLREYAASIGKSVADAAGEWKAYKAAQNTVLQNASNAYATAGLSANAYMETVTGFAASLKQSFDGTAAGAQAAAIAADMAVTDIADNANKMGTPMERITDAYQGFAKQNYTMLDNLKLGYGGTKTEMERLLADAQKLTGVKYDINNLADVYSAIHVIQGELGITGTTAKEAMSTIQGSLNMTKAAWENVLTALGGGGELDGAVTNLITSGRGLRGKSPAGRQYGTDRDRFGAAAACDGGGRLCAAACYHADHAGSGAADGRDPAVHGACAGAADDRPGAGLGAAGDDHTGHNGARDESPAADRGGHSAVSGACSGAAAGDPRRRFGHYVGHSRYGRGNS